MSMAGNAVEARRDSEVEEVLGRLLTLAERLSTQVKVLHGTRARALGEPPEVEAPSPRGSHLKTVPPGLAGQLSEVCDRLELQVSSVEAHTEQLARFV